MAEQSSIARPYARAIFDLARESGQLGGWSDTLHAAGMTVADPAVARMIDAPRSDHGKILALIADVCGQATTAPIDHGQVKNLLRLLAENGRLPLLSLIAAQFDKLKADVENIVDVVLTAAQPVDETQQSRIADALRKRFGREVNLQFKLDENLIGGARLQADDLVIDGSIRTGLAKLASSLTN